MQKGDLVALILAKQEKEDARKRKMETFERAIQDENSNQRLRRLVGAGFEPGGGSGLGGGSAQGGRPGQSGRGGGQQAQQARFFYDDGRGRGRRDMLTGPAAAAAAAALPLPPNRKAGESPKGRKDRKGRRPVHSVVQRRLLARLARQAGGGRGGSEGGVSPTSGRASSSSSSSAASAAAASSRGTADASIGISSAFIGYCTNSK